MITKHIGGEIPQPFAELIELEASKSNRTVGEQLLHILSNRYKALQRICGCGFFIYNLGDDHRCSECNDPCCSLCSVPVKGERVLCNKCATSAGIDRRNTVSFRVAGEGKL